MDKDKDMDVSIKSVKQHVFEGFISGRGSECQVIDSKQRIK